jgi:DNA (cytosine-5)-methyltransferase 1
MTAVRELVGIKQRYLTVREKAWLQGFPPDFEFLGNQVQTCRMIGNAWCVNVARGIGMEIKRCLQSTMHIV